MARLLTIALILIAGAAVLAPVVAYFKPAPLPGDFIIPGTDFHVSVLYSLGASVDLGLAYMLILKR